MKDQWKICIAGVIATAVVSVPSWLPVFGIEPEWLGGTVMKTISAVVPFVAFTIGVAIGWNAKKWQTTKEINKNYNEIKRRCMACSKRKKAILLKALEGEDVLLSMMDGDATSLCDAKLMHAAPVGGITYGVNFYVHPDAVVELSEHRYEWLGIMTREDRDRLIEGDSVRIEKDGVERA